MDEKKVMGWGRFKAVMKNEYVRFGIMWWGAVALFFAPLAFGYWLPRGGGDLVSFLWPMSHFSARAVGDGILPFWNPHLYSGAPFAADNQTGLFYPLNLLVYLVGGPPSYQMMMFLAVFHVWLAGFNCYVLVRGLRLPVVAAGLGG
ncbi:MAG TPA: hypothetical protein VLL52_05435, partial [Anaerolineae bacterium]|nr:hypothetical protein [Anaerolineae bacterium]